MKILIFHQFFWAHYKAKIYSELQKITNQYPDVELLVLQTALNEKTRANMGKINWEMHQYNVKLLFEQYYEDTKLWERVKKGIYWINHFKPDVVNLPGYYEPAMNILLFYCKLKGIKVILAIDSTEGDNPNVGWREKIKSFIIKSADGFFCYGSKAAEYMLKLGAEPSEILLENNSVDNQKVAEIHQIALSTRNDEKQKLQLKPLNFIYVGRMIPFKNLPKLVKAYHQIKAENWGLIIVGDGEEEHILKQYVADNQLDGVKFVPSKPWYDIPKLMALADVFILPSYSEPWGLVVNEAMACGMPVIVSKTCGSAFDLVKENENGYTFDPFQIEELSFYMQKMTQKSNVELVEMGGRSKEIIKRFSPEIVAEEMFQGFRKVLK